MVRIALTGGIATGKSHVRRRFDQRGVPTIDADELARHVVAPGTPGAAAVRARFGDRVFAEDGHLDRAALGRQVFADPQARHDLEAIVHPAVYQAIQGWFESLPPATPLAVADIPLLFETGRAADFDLVVVTSCTPAEQLRRVMARDRLTEEEARRRLAAQWPIAEKARRADAVIETMGSTDETDTQVDALIARLRGSQAG